MQNYKALAAIWPTLTGNDIWAKLEALNATVATPETKDEKGIITPSVLWYAANGWQGPINQNDLVVVNIIDDKERIIQELETDLITQDQASRLLAHVNS